MNYIKFNNTYHIEENGILRCGQQVEPPFTRHTSIDESNLCKVCSSETVNHPKHYNSHPSGIECIEIIRWMPYNIGAAMKYLWRSGLKSDNPIEDLEKAIWYLQDEIKRLKGDYDSQRQMDKR